jgi:ribosomal-protein-alanine N-acetyltransferase
MGRRQGAALGDHGYGPWAIVLDDRVAGVGGLHPTDGGEPEVALVLTPAARGMGKTILEWILQEASDVLALLYVLVLFPPIGRRSAACSG